MCPRNSTRSAHNQRIDCTAPRARLANATHFCSWLDHGVGDMKQGLLITAALALSGCAGSQPQTLLVSDYEYVLNGRKAQAMTSFEKVLRAAVPIEIQACQCADAVRLTSAIEWLQSRGATAVSLVTLAEDQPQCGQCK
jgi:hypothetical protein